MSAKEERRKAAQERQEAYDKLTTQQKIQKLEAQGFRSGKQHKKLLKKLAEESK